MVGEYLDYQQCFEGGKASSSGGVTGSKRVKSNLDGQDYQVKNSILDAKLSRKLKAGNLDRENFGEIIASSIGRSVMDSKIELVPQVSLVYDSKKKKVLAASRYLQNIEGGTLNDYAIKTKGRKPKGRIIQVVTKDPVELNQLNVGGDEYRVLRQDLANAIAISALVGDHDVNLGNMVVVKDDVEQLRVARIDFGHAFNDLLNASSMFGGKVRNKDNQILDFLNRETVSHLDPRRRVSKLWRNYDGIVPSPELVSAFQKFSQSSNLLTGISGAQQSFMKLIEDLEQDSLGNRRIIEHIKKSLIAVSKNVSAESVKASLPIKIVIDQVFKNIHEYCSNGQKKMQEVAELMQMQLAIDEMILDKKNNKPIKQSSIDEIYAQYKQMRVINGIGLKYRSGIRWVKTTQEMPAFKGNLKAYIKYRSKILGLDKKTSMLFANEAFTRLDQSSFFSRLFNKKSDEPLKSKLPAMATGSSQVDLDVIKSISAVMSKSGVACVPEFSIKSAQEPKSSLKQIDLNTRRKG